MTHFLGKFLLLLLLVMPATILLCGHGRGNGMLVSATEDPMEGEDDGTTVETDEVTETTEPDVPETEAEPDTAVTEKEGEEEEPLKPSPDADTTLLFINHNTLSGEKKEITSGKLVRLLVGFTNKGEKDFIVQSLDASFRYPQDFSFYVQNFSTVELSQTIEPKKQATFEYVFSVNEAFNARPFGLIINLYYKDSDSTIFQTAVYNETVMVVEPDEGLDGETFFLYLFMAAVGVLLLFGAHQMVTVLGKKKRLLKPKKVVEMGTQNSHVDYEWIPKETLQGINRSPRRTPKQSPRQRRNKRSSGSGEE
ncbi:translocon-associated protein subunit alpha-like [Gigantopelta aegis]|uniref:translocon-associated protein subunit alpha-like n=1 Tax=Gigantopelta aegis TaxID=1735272 RepID=UPI001B88D106|nr:translocon-associated protein subunit alpha-like [Gigantopelta aegis]